MLTYHDVTIQRISIKISLYDRIDVIVGTDVNNDVNRCVCTIHHFR